MWWNLAVSCRGRCSGAGPTWSRVADLSTEQVLLRQGSARAMEEPARSRQLPQELLTRPGHCQSSRGRKRALLQSYSPLCSPRRSACSGQAPSGRSPSRSLAAGLWPGEHWGASGQHWLPWELPGDPGASEPCWALCWAPRFVSPRRGSALPESTQ